MIVFFSLKSPAFISSALNESSFAHKNAPKRKGEGRARTHVWSSGKFSARMNPTGKSFPL